MGDAEILHQRHRTRRIRNLDRQVNIPTMSTPGFSYVLCLDIIRCVEKVRQLLNRPVMSLFGNRMSGTSTEMVSHRIQLKPSTTTRRYRIFNDDRDLGVHDQGKESLSETSRPDFISTVRPDLSQPTHWSREEDTLGGILFLRLKTSHLRPEYRVLNSNHYALL